MENVVIPSEPTTRLVVLTRSRKHQGSDSSSNRPTRPTREEISPEDSNLNRLLDLAAEFVLAATGATGAAIALVDNTGLHCRASTGDAPDKGVAIRTENTLSGECIRTGQIVRRDVASPGTSPARSILLLPIPQHRTVAGIMGLFWRDPYSCNDSKIAIARAAAMALAVTLDPTYGAPRVAPEPVSDQSTGTSHSPTVKTAESARKGPGVRKRLFRRPCTQCGAYYYTDEPNCPVCTPIECDAPLE